MKYHVIVSGEGHDCQLFVGFEGKPEGDASAADIIACLAANPEAAAEVIRGLEPRCCADSRANLLARAEQAERSLATLRELIHTASGLDDHRYSAEQMVKEMAERWQGASDDCEKAEQALATVTAELVKADKHADDLSATIERAREVARLDRAAATKANDTAKRYQVERDAAVARELQWERLASELSDGHDGLGDFREWCEQLKCDYDVECGIRSQREGEIEALNAKLAEAERSFAGYNAGLHVVALRENDALRARLAKTEAVVEAARTDLRTADILIEGAHAGAGGTTAERLEQATRGIRAALRALDNDSGGSGAVASGRASEPEPAGLLCRHCGGPLRFDCGLADGCPCNSRRGINHGRVPTHVCTCAECDPEQTGAVRRKPEPAPAPYGHVSRANERQVNEPDPQAPATRAEQAERERDYLRELQAHALPTDCVRCGGAGAEGRQAVQARREETCYQEGEEEVMSERMRRLLDYVQQTAPGVLVAGAVITYADEPSPETGHVGWCWWAMGSMGDAPTYEAARDSAVAEIQRRMDRRMAVL